MGNQCDRNMEHRETVTLVLKTKLFEVDKQKLINKSRYFAALLSANYMEFHQSEHIINYEIPLLSFEDFINWVHHDKLLLSIVNNENKFEHLLILLELSVLFAVDELIEDVTNMLETYYLLPEHVIDIWLLAQELSLNVLRDSSLSVCLDYFMEVPYSSLHKLSKQNFLKLVGNINVRSTKPYLVCTIHEWMELHQDTIPLDIINNKRPRRILHGIISCENLDVINSKLYLHCWDDEDKVFFEFTTFEYPKEFWDFTNSSNSKNTLSGMQITAGGYNLYLSGGEFGIGSGKFNTKVWRYSLISKKWFFQAVMPCPRRHMVAVFLKNKLLLVGGVGQYRLKLKSLDIYDVYTGTWRKGANIPTDFTNVPDHLVLNEKLIIYDLTTFICIYCPNRDTWTYVNMRSISDVHYTLSVSNQLNVIHIEPTSLITPILVPKVAPCYIDTTMPDEIILKSIVKDMASCHKICSCDKIVFTDVLWDPSRFEEITKLLYVRLERKLNENEQEEIVVVGSNGYDQSDHTFYLHDVHILDQHKFRSLLFSHSHKRFFTMIDPTELHTLSVNLDNIT